jgi:flagellar protein FlbD
MIIVSRLNGEALAVNAELVERIEAMPDTVVTLLDGKKILVLEPVDELIARILEYRASILRLAYSEAGPATTTSSGGARPSPLRLVPETAGDEHGERR